jgi:polyphosphate kinase 2 (PPK2 family)
MLIDRRRNKDVHCTVAVASITEKLQEARLRWYGHMQWREDTDCITGISVAEVFGHRSRGWQKKRWRDMVQRNTKELQLTPKDADDRTKWKRRTHADDPSPGD